MDLQCVVLVRVRCGPAVCGVGESEVWTCSVWCEE